MSVFLLSWNPESSEQKDFSKEAKNIFDKKRVIKSWSVTNSLKPKPNDRFYIVKVGNNGRGIFGSGKILSYPEKKPHYNSELSKKGKVLNFCDVEFEYLFQNILLKIEDLNNINNDIEEKQNWTPQNSGIIINDDAVLFLDGMWNQQVETLLAVTEKEYLDTIGELDTLSYSKRRLEQSFLRGKLFGINKYAQCCICQEFVPIKLLVCAHIKKRSECTYEEKVDYKNIVAPMCYFGCDILYEKGYISVRDGIVVSLVRDLLLEKSEAYIENIKGNKVDKYYSDSRVYFDWHYKINTGK